MAFDTTRTTRANQWRKMRGFIATTVAVSILQFAPAADLAAQPKPPSKSQIKPRKPAAPPQESEADKLNAKWLSKHNDSQAAATPAPANPSQAATAAPAEPDDERVSSLPSTTSASGPGARSIVSGSVSLVKVGGSGLATTFASIGASNSTFKELTQALAGFAPNSAKLDVWKGRTVDGTQRILVASLGEASAKQSFWWFAPPNQPEGWFDENGRRLGGTALAEPRPDSRISSPFGIRRYYGRSSGGGFHNGIDFEGKTGELIFAAADGVINHQGWYFNYGRTVKISHADNFETLYAHMSRFAEGMGPGSRVRKGDLIGYIGSTGRSTGAHLHFSVIMNGQFVDPAPYISEKGGNSVLVGEGLVAYRLWQVEIRKAAGVNEERNGRPNRGGLQGADPWSHNPFASGNVDRL